MKLKLFATITLFSGLVLARVTDGQTNFTIERNILNILVKKGFHLNSEAPAYLTFDGLEAQYKPTQKSENIFSFKIVEGSKIARLNYYVCDDKKTVCEQHQEKLDLQTLKISGEQIIKENKRKTEIKQPQDSNLISTNNKIPTLLVFSAPWCPACIRMQTETYNSILVKNQIAKINFKKINNDLPENYELAEKFHIRAIPTAILLDSEGEEVYRWLDYQEANEFAKSLKEKIKNTSINKSVLQKNAKLGDAEAISALGMMAYNALDCAEAIKWLSLSKKTSDQKYKLAAEVSCALDAADENEKLKFEYLQSLQKAMVLTTSKLDELRWFVDWLEKTKEDHTLTQDIKIKANQSIKILTGLLQNSKKLKNEFLQSTYGEIESFEKAEALLMISKIYGALENKVEKEKINKDIISEINKKKISVLKPGYMLIAISYLREAGEIKKVDSLYQQLVKKYSDSSIYYEKYARFQLVNKKLEKALELTDKALSCSDVIAARLYLLKARIYKELNQNENAVKTVDVALALKDIEHVQYKNVFSQLKKIKSDLVSIK